MTDTKMYDPACEWCAGTGRRASRPHAWYQTHSDMVTTMFPCTCGTLPAPPLEPTAPVGARDIISASLRRSYMDSDGHYAHEADAILASLRANGLVIVAEADLAAARPAGDRVMISVEAKEILDRILYKHGDTYAFLEPLRDALATPAPGKVQNGDVYHRAVVDVRETLEGIARMTDEERRKVASLQNQAVWIVYSLQQEGLLATPAPGGPGSEADHD